LLYDSVILSVTCTLQLYYTKYTRYSCTGLHLPYSIYKKNNIPIYESNSGCINSIDGDMRYKVYIYIRVSLFGLSPRRTNIMNSTIDLIQLVLPTSTYNIIWLCVLITLFSIHDLLTFWSSPDSIISTVNCLSALLEFTTHFHVHICYLSTPFGIHFTFSLGCFSDNPWTYMSKFKRLERGRFPRRFLAQRKRGDPVVARSLPRLLLTVSRASFYCSCASIILNSVNSFVNCTFVLLIM